MGEPLLETITLPTFARRFPAIILLSLSILLAACGGGAGVSATPGAPTAEPGQAVDVDALVKEAAANDGKAVRVTGFFLADPRTARLCAVSLESYPPQCGGGSVRVIGEVPRDVLDHLERTSDPTLAQATWGWIVATGTFRAAGANGEPTLELGEIIIPEG